MKYAIVPPFRSETENRDDALNAVSAAGGEIIFSPKEEIDAPAYLRRSLVVDFKNAAMAEKVKTSLPKGWNIYPVTEYAPPKTL